MFPSELSLFQSLKFLASGGTGEQFWGPQDLEAHFFLASGTFHFLMTLEVFFNAASYVFRDLVVAFSPYEVFLDFQHS